MKTSKLFTLLSIVLATGIIAVLLFRTFPKKENIAINKPESTSTSGVPGIPSLKKDTNAKQQALNKGYINYIQSLRRDSIASASATIVCGGTIIELYSIPWQDERFDNHKFELGMKLVDSSYDCQYLLYDKLALSNLKFYKMVNGEKVEISFKDLELGDKIISRTDIDLLNPTNANSASNLIKSVVIKL